MDNFNKTRFFNFGKYDFTINKSFYRNMLLTTIFGCLGIALVGFTIRWNIYSNSYYSQPLQDYYNPEIVTTTAALILVFCLVMMVIFAGYTFHNLRTKQGRITEFTIPATNIERWTWHVLVSFLGGLAACITGILCADLFNEILNLIVYHGQFNSSLSADVFRMVTFSSVDLDDDKVNFNNLSMVMNPVYIYILVVSSFISEISYFVFGNSIKYRYNIIITYIALQIIGTFLSVVLFVFAGMIANFVNYELQEEEAMKLMKCATIGTAIILDIIAALCYWGSYRNYCKAQITSKLNH